jgi:hypothetical protein
MKKAIIISVFLLSLLQGCAFDGFFQKKNPPIIPNKEVRIDARAMEPCLPLEIIKVDRPEFLDILNNLDTNTKLYNDCATKQSNSIKLLKQFSVATELK